MHFQPTVYAFMPLLRALDSREEIHALAGGAVQVTEVSSPPLSRFLLPAVLACMAAASGAASSPAAEPLPPPSNIIVILADDLGWTDLGCMGSRYYETPNIDRLAAQGMRLLRHSHCQNCTPTRAALMSGQYPPRTGIYTVGTLERGESRDRKLRPPRNETRLPLDRKTIADQLRAAGYATGLFGKWHIGEDGDHHPSRRGFDEAITSMGRHFRFQTRPDVPGHEDFYLADFLTEKAVDFLRRHRDRPFFLYLSHFAVHSPHEAKAALIEEFKSKPPAGGHHDPTYAAMIYSVDESVGRVMAVLDELKLAERTLVIFASDNGGVGGYREIGGKGVTDNAPLRGGKRMLYEGGVPVPWIVRWPGVVPPAVTCDTPTAHVDLFPTLLEAARAPEPAQVLDGESLVPLFRDPAAKLRRDAIFAHLPGYLEGYGTSRWRSAPAGSVVAGDWKLLEFYEDGRLELYNLREDVGETRNLAAELPAKAKELRARLAAWRRELGAVLPGPNPEYVPGRP